MLHAMDARQWTQIVVLDDVPAIRQVLQAMLTHLSYPVVVMGDVPTAVAHWATTPSAILLADGMFLQEYAATLRATLVTHAARLLVMSGYPPEALLRLANIPYGGFLHKPFSIDAMGALLCQIAFSAERQYLDGKRVHGIC